MEEKSIFVKEVTAIAERLADLVKTTVSQDGKKRAVIVLSAEALDNGGSANIISIMGDGRQAFEVLTDFATQRETRDLFKAAATFAILKDHIK